MNYFETFKIDTETNFTNQDLNPEMIEWVDSESHRIASGILAGGYKNKNSLSGRPRTYEEIKRDATYGLIAEAYFIQYHSYTNNRKKWHDVITPEGVEVEVKTYNGNSIKTRFNQILKLENRKTKYKHVIMFKRLDGNYTFDSYWEYNYDKEIYEEVKWQDLTHIGK